MALKGSVTSDICIMLLLRVLEGGVCMYPVDHYEPQCQPLVPCICEVSWLAKAKGDWAGTKCMLLQITPQRGLAHANSDISSMLVTTSEGGSG